jgi:outer membrane protein OmpA-like peptidoglycan-associated protein
LRRAEAVKRYLVVNGVEASRLDAVGFGAERLALPDRPEDAANRRVEIRNLGEGQ